MGEERGEEEEEEERRGEEEEEKKRRRGEEDRGAEAHGDKGRQQHKSPTGRQTTLTGLS
jgi:hypothetical protein